MKLLPTATGIHGIHISAELRVNAIQLRSYNINWAADCMERAAKHIDALEVQANEQHPTEEGSRAPGKDQDAPPRARA